MGAESTATRWWAETDKTETRLKEEMIERLFSVILDVENSHPFKKFLQRPYSPEVPLRLSGLYSRLST